MKKNRCKIRLVSRFWTSIEMGVLNIVNLLHLYKNIPSRSLVGQEIIKVISFLLEKNLYSKSLMTRVEINLDVYLKVLN